MGQVYRRICKVDQRVICQKRKLGFGSSWRGLILGCGETFQRRGLNLKLVAVCSKITL